MKAKKAFGQNFLIDNFYIDSIVNSVNANESDLIIEIGPGRGALTKKLKNKKSQLIAYELDTDLKPILANLIDDKTEVKYQDFLTTDLSNIKKIAKRTFIVGNLPYYITTPIIEHIINSQIEVEEMVMMVQKEVADRFLAIPHSKDYGYFTLYLKYYFEIERVVDVPRTAFNPAPKVNSTVLKFKKRINKPTVDESKYFSLLKKSFQQKRKQLKNNLKEYDFNYIKDILAKYNLSETVRAEELSEDIFVDIVNSLK